MIETETGTWTEYPNPIADAWRAQWPDVPPPRAYTCGPLRAMIGREPIGPNGDDDWRWHISLSCEDRLPTWDELAGTAHGLRPGVVFVVGVPPRSWWINVHRYTLHLAETRDENLIEHWRAQRRGDRPS